MAAAKKGIDLRDINFRQLVKACASDAEIVAYFNQTHGTNLTCPITALIEPIFPLEMSENEMTQIAWFVAWVQHNQWQRLRAAASNIAKLKRFYRKRVNTGRVH